MRLLFGFNGKSVAQIEGATQVPREGEWIYLNITGTDELFTVRRVVWEAKLIEGNEGKEGFARAHKEEDVYVLLDSIGKEKESASSTTSAG
jgi:hypothetical protein